MPRLTYHDNMLPAEISAFMAEIDALDACYASQPPPVPATDEDEEIEDQDQICRERRP